MKRLARFARKLQRGPRPTHWEGVYARPSEVPVSGAGFDSDVWIDMTRRLTANAVEVARTPQSWTLARSDVQLLAALLAGSNRSSASILDFGGGMGIGYVMLRSALASSYALDYHVVEGPRVCAEGKQLVGDVAFAIELPDDKTRFDVVYACSSLQYIDDHASLFSRFASYQAPHILFADVPAGANPTFWTAQRTVPGSSIAYKFMNLEELVRAMAHVDYKLLVRGVSERPLDVASLPPSHRVERTCNLLFGR